MPKEAGLPQLQNRRRDFASRIIMLYSANPAYPPRRFSGPELEDIRIAGRVAACFHRA